MLINVHLKFVYIRIAQNMFLVKLKGSQFRYKVLDCLYLIMSHYLQLRGWHNKPHLLI